MKKSLDYAIIPLECVKALSVMERSMTKCQKNERDEKRRDSKGRLLKSGESQRTDGRYTYKYTDAFGEPKFVYSWKLVPTDKNPCPENARIFPCVRKSSRYKKDLDDGIDTIGKKMTVCQLYEKYIRQRGQCEAGNP